MIRFIGDVVCAGIKGDIIINDGIKKQYPTLTFGFENIREHEQGSDTLFIVAFLTLKVDRKKGQRGRRKRIECDFTVGIDIKSIKIWTDPTALWRLTNEDAQGYVESILNLARPLNDDELHSIKKGCEWGFGDAKDDVLGTAVKEAVNIGSDFESDEDDRMGDEEKDARQRIRRLIQTCFDVPDDKDKVQTTINDVMNNVDEDIVYYEPKKLPEAIEKLGYKLKEK